MLDRADPRSSGEHDERAAKRRRLRRVRGIGVAATRELTEAEVAEARKDVEDDDVIPFGLIPVDSEIVTITHPGSGDDLDMALMARILRILEAEE